MQFCSHRLAVAVCIAILLHGRATLAEPPREDQTQHDNSDATKTKKKLKAGKRAAGRKSKHPGFSVGDALTFDFTGRIEGDLRQATPALGYGAAQTQWQDRRVGVKGTALNRISFEVSRELGQDFETQIGLSEKTAWRDVYARTWLTETINVQAGHFKLPFGYEEMTGETDLDFIYRSLSSRVLAPGRDTGVGIDGRLRAPRRIGYAVGFFTRDGSNARTSQTEGGRDALAGRVTISPFESPKALAPFTLGFSAARSHLDDNLGLRGRTVLGDGIFFERSYVNGARQRFAADASWAGGPASVAGEYIWDSDERLGMGFNGDNIPSVHAAGWYIAGTWALTGERKHGRLEPRREFFGQGLGAFELVARYEALRFNDATYPGAVFGFPTSQSLQANGDRATTVGLNWYLNRYVKLQGDVIHEAIADPPRSPAPSTGGRFTSAVLRFQFRL
jgi:phosphate-selective porin OprO and OprP